MFCHKSWRESAFVYHESVPIEKDECWGFFLMVEEVLKLVNLITYDIKQMDVPFSS